MDYSFRRQWLIRQLLSFLYQQALIKKHHRVALTPFFCEFDMTEIF